MTMDAAATEFTPGATPVADTSSNSMEPSKNRTFSADAAIFKPMGKMDFAPSKGRTFSADAAVFKPMSGTEPASFDEGSEEIALKAAAWAAEMMAWCPTAAPSPAMSAMSSMPGSAPWTPYTWDGSMGTWPAAALSGLMADDTFALPEAEEATHASGGNDTNEDGEGDETADFNFAGMKELLESSILASLQAADMEIGGAVDKQSHESRARARTTSSILSVEADRSSDSSSTPKAEIRARIKDVSAKIQPPPGLEELRDESKWPAGTTTVMLRNIPNKYTQKMLVDVIQKEGYKGEVDFMYLPIDFKNKCNVGYVFINFRSEHACSRFAAEFHQATSKEKLPGFNSQKICEVVPAKFQGQMENVRRLQTNPVMAQLLETPEWLPQVFDEEGNELPFPMANSSNNKNTKGRAGSSRDAKGRKPAAAPASSMERSKQGSKEVRGRQWD